MDLNQEWKPDIKQERTKTIESYKDKLNPRGKKKKTEALLFLTASNLKSVSNLLKTLSLLITKLRAYLTQDSGKLHEEILLSNPSSNPPAIPVGPPMK